MSISQSLDCDHSAEGMCARCALTKSFDLAKVESSTAAQIECLSFNGLLSIDAARSKSSLLSYDVRSDNGGRLVPRDVLKIECYDTASNEIVFTYTCSEDDSIPSNSRDSLRIDEEGGEVDEDDVETKNGGKHLIIGESDTLDFQNQPVDGNKENAQTSISVYAINHSGDHHWYHQGEDASHVDELSDKKSQCWLLRLFESSFFDIDIFMEYLAKSKDAGVLNYLGNRLFDYQAGSIQFYLPQLINLYVNNREIAKAIHPYIYERCSGNLEFSLECFWLLEAYGAFKFRKQKSNSHGHRLQQHILSEFRSGVCNFDEDVSLKSKGMGHERSMSEATLLSMNEESSAVVNSQQSRTRKSGSFGSLPSALGDLTTGRAFNNGCRCADEESDNSSSTQHSRSSCSCFVEALGIEVQREFVNALMNVSYELEKTPSKNYRSSLLVNELIMVDLNLPARVWLPLYSPKTKHVVLRIPNSASCVLNSKDKAPYCLYVEVLEVENISKAVIPERISDIEAAELQRRQRKHLSEKEQNIVTNRELANEEIKGTTDDERLYSAHKDKNRPVISAADIRQRLSNCVMKPGLQLRHIADDPSASTLSEPWVDKLKRMRESSPYGHLPNWNLLPVIIKIGDDLRQELLACQLLAALQNIWTEEKVPLYLRPYRIVVCSSNTGMIEPIINACSLHQIKKNLMIHSSAKPSSSQEINHLTLLAHFHETFGVPNGEPFLRAQQNFIQSCAGYSLACYLLQVKDRHNGNILLDSDGHLIHIDFGYILSISPRNLGFETSPFKLTQELIDVMGGYDSDHYKYYKILFLRGLIAARKHHNRIVNIVEIMLNGSQLPCFRGGVNTIKALKSRFHMNCTEEQLRILVDTLVEQSRDSLTTRLYDNYQYFSNGIF